MAQLTRASIVTQGLLAAGRTDITTFANIRLNSWLRKTYKSWPWPFLKTRNKTISLTSGTTSLLLGAGSGGVTLEIQRIFKQGKIYSSDYTKKGLLQLAGANTASLFNDPDVNNPATNSGIPTYLYLESDPSGIWGKWQLKPWPIPDVNYLLVLDYMSQPADIDTSTAGDSIIPIYPNDDTLIQAVKVIAADYMNEPDMYEREGKLLDEMSVHDKLRTGEMVGLNDKVELDPSVFG